MASSEEGSSHSAHRDEEQGDADSEHEAPEMNFLATLFLLAAVTVVRIPTISVSAC